MQQRQRPQGHHECDSAEDRGQNRAHPQRIAAGPAGPETCRAPWTRARKRCDNRRLMRTIGTSLAARGPALGVACAAVALLLAGCGGSGAQKSQAQALGNVSVLGATAPLSSRLVTDTEISKASDA